MPGLNPHESRWKTFSSKNGDSLVTSACWTILSRMVGIPRGLFFPFFFGMRTRLTGDGLYVLFLRSDSRLAILPSRSSSNVAMETPSTPPAPLLALTLSHASVRARSLRICP